MNDSIILSGYHDVLFRKLGSYDDNLRYCKLDKRLLRNLRFFQLSGKYGWLSLKRQKIGNVKELELGNHRNSFLKQFLLFRNPASTIVLKWNIWCHGIEYLLEFCFFKSVPWNHWMFATALFPTAGGGAGCNTQHMSTFYLSATRAVFHMSLIPMNKISFTKLLLPKSFW